MTIEEEIFQEILRIRRERPQLRLAQILSNVLPEGVTDLYYVEDAALLLYLSRYMQ